MLQSIVSNHSHWERTTIEIKMPNKTNIVLKSELKQNKTIEMVLKNYYFFSRLYCEGSLGLAQAVMSGDIESKELPNVLEFLENVIELNNLNVIETHEIKEIETQKVEFFNLKVELRKLVGSGNL